MRQKVAHNQIAFKGLKLSTDNAVYCNWRQNEFPGTVHVFPPWTMMYSTVKMYGKCIKTTTLNEFMIVYTIVITGASITTEFIQMH